MEMPNNSDDWWDAKKDRDAARRNAERNPDSAGYRNDLEEAEKAARSKGVRDDD